MSRHYPRRVSPFRNPRIKACLAAPRGLSQLATSFIASQHQGIHRLPLIAWPQNNKHNHAVLLYWRLISISKLSKSNFKWPLGQVVKLSISLFLGLTDHWQFNKSTKVVEVNGFEPMASCVQGRRSPNWATPPTVHSDKWFALCSLPYAWWAWMELNHRPHAYQACALTKLSYRPPTISDLRSRIKSFYSLNNPILKSKIHLSLSSYIKEHSLISQN